LPDKITIPSKPLQAGLYLVATPIGNLEDITLRALRVLRDVDAIACEDTRTGKKLLEHYDIHKPLIPYHEHSRDDERARLMDRIKGGKSVALISDAGTPLISDPGFKLVRMLQAEGLYVTSIPGPCAAMVGVTLAGIATDRFYFAGFVPNKAQARRQWFDDLAGLQATLIAYESPHRIMATMELLAEIWPKREMAIVREITKRYEEVMYAPAEELLTQLQARPALRGEIVLVMGGESKEVERPSEQALDELLRELLQAHSVNEASKIASQRFGMKKRELYNRALRLKDEL